MDILMPQLGESVAEGSIVEWLKKEGDTVEKGDVLFEVETDKATMEVPALAPGKLARIHVAAGEVVPVGTVVGVLDNGTMQPAATVAAPPAPEPAAAAQVVNEASSHDGGRFGKARLPDGRRITPLARRLAVEHGIDPLEISGASDTIRRDDILAALDVQAGDSPAPEAAPPPARGLPDIPHETIALSAMRRTIARRLTQSKQQVPHIYLTVDVRLDALLELRAELNASLDAQGIKLSVNDMIIKALALALDRVPECNVQFDEDRLIAFHRSDIAVAVSLPGGLITPVVVDAGSLSLSVIAKRMRDLAERARSGKLQPHEYQGGTASLSNMGMFGIKQFEAVINPPQAMILAVGAAELRPVFVEDRVEGFTIMSVTGSFDHRAIDGADGARLMTTFKSLVEEPLSLVV